MQEFQSEDITKLAKALLEVQRVLQPAIKDAINPFAKNRYASLNSIMEVCREPLLDHGIWLCQYPVPVESVGANRAYSFGGNGVSNQEPSEVYQQNHCLGLVTKLTHAETGQWQASLAVVPMPKADPQGMGSAITYARRYALSAMLGIVTEEDTDGEMSNYGKAQTTKQKRQPSQNSANAKTKESVNHGVETKSQANQSSQANQQNLPMLNGVVYDSITAQDDKGVMREVITASGNTIPNKNTLMQLGFRWNPNKKIWWMYADAN